MDIYHFLPALLSSSHKGHKELEQGVYDIDDATDIVYEALPENIKSSLQKSDGFDILEYEFLYQQKIGFTGDEPTIEENYPLNKFIYQEALKNNKIYSYDIIDHVLKAEEVYLKKVGILL